MDVRITNTCNNNCLYCLEQEYRKKWEFIAKEDVFKLILTWDNIITFYWWNCLLHPEIESIISFCKDHWFTSIWMLTNTFWITAERLNRLMQCGVNSVWFYFNSFDCDTHNVLVNGWIRLKSLLENIALIQQSWIFYKAIIHVNKQNINSLYQDIYILYMKYGVTNFEFINYFPFDRPYDSYKHLLLYSFEENRKSIDLVFKIIKKHNLDVRFMKFSKDFFWDYWEFYDFEIGIGNQIWPEDRERLETENPPFCFIENRCISCFIKDNCKFYEWKI